MIKVIDEVTGTAIKIEVTGRPYCIQLRIGKTGSWTVKRGRTAGKVKTGEQWGFASYHGSLKQALEHAITLISEQEGMPEKGIKLSDEELWKKLIDAEERRTLMLQKVSEGFQGIVDKYGKELSALTKMLGGGELPEEDSAGESEEEIVEEKPADIAETMPKLAARLAEEGIR